MEACACAEESCERADPAHTLEVPAVDPPKVSDEREAQFGWIGPPDNARCDHEDDKEGSGLGLIESEATSTEADETEMQGLVDSSSGDEDTPDMQLSAVKHKVLRARQSSQRPNAHPKNLSRK